MSIDDENNSCESKRESTEELNVVSISVILLSKLSSVSVSYANKEEVASVNSVSVTNVLSSEDENDSNESIRVSWSEPVTSNSSTLLSWLDDVENNLVISVSFIELVDSTSSNLVSTEDENVWKFCVVFTSI